jgi:hypothetical protein
MYPAIVVLAGLNSSKRGRQEINCVSCCAVMLENGSTSNVLVLVLWSMGSI